MKTLRQHLQQYLQLRRRLGFKLRDAGSMLSKFVRFAHRQNATFVTTQLALRWATQPVDCHPALWTTRLSMVRQFAQYVSAVDPRTEIPPPGLLPHRYRRKPPYLYSDQEVRALMAAAQQLPSPRHLRGATYATLFGLLAVTGMRVGEALGLDRADVDLAQALLTVRQTKGNKARLVPLHPSTNQALRRYERLRDRVCPRPQSPRFFLSERGGALTYWIVRYWFIQVSRQIGLRQPADRHGPRIHELRHRFSIRTLVHWYRTGQDVEAHLPELATYLGHGHVTDTYWYLSATLELLHWAKDVDLVQGVLVIVGAKFGKTRLVPIHASTQEVLARYVRERDRALGENLPYFFVSRRGNRLDGGQVRRTFYRLSRKIGIRGPTASHGPRLHDFRHRFAAESLVRWYRSGQDVERRLPVLSTYLGHGHVSDTYWYLTICPELMGLVVNRLESYWEKSP